MNLFWGVHPVRQQQTYSADDMVSVAEKNLLQLGRIKAGDVLAVVAGTQMASGSTNFMRLHVVTPVVTGTQKALRGRRSAVARKEQSKHGL
jgi:hypothetical protein